MMANSEGRPCSSCGKPKRRPSYLPSQWDDDANRLCGTCRRYGQRRQVVIRKVEPIPRAACHPVEKCIDLAACELHRRWA